MLKALNREMQAFFDELYPDKSKVLVFGEGDPGAALVLVGEAPGEQETLMGRPFVGKAGKNLDFFLEKTGFTRGNLYITNTVKFRPTKVSAAGRQVNRPPTKEEVALFLPWLKREIGLVKPRCVVTLGNTPLKALLGNKAVIGEMHGEAIEGEDYVLFPLYHPASLIYNRSLSEVYERDLTRLAAWRTKNNC